jgi:hypothetical protein
MILNEFKLYEINANLDKLAPVDLTNTQINPPINKSRNKGPLIVGFIHHKI